MISLELAEKLMKHVEWEIAAGMCISRLYNQGLKKEYREEIYLCGDELIHYEECNGDIVFPSFSQLLAEIEGRGYGWETGKTERKYKGYNYYTELSNMKNINDIECYDKSFGADTPEDAAAQALLWILERGRGDE